jgi:uncharacterized protein YcbX
VSVVVSSLALYPVKACRPLHPEAVELFATGLAGDREWLVIDASDRFISQREAPALALVSAKTDRFSLTVSAPGLPELCVRREEAARRQVTIWRDQAWAFDAGPEASDWFSRYLRRPARLVRFDVQGKRLCNPAFAGDSGAHTFFADGYPLLVANEASLGELNGLLEEALPMSRFRPNIVLCGLDPYDEDHIEALRIDDITLALVKPCTRCQVTTVNQDTADVGMEPLPTLARTRHNAELGGVVFGVNAIVTSGAGSLLRRGASVEVVWRF